MIASILWSIDPDALFLFFIYTQVLAQMYVLVVFQTKFKRNLDKLSANIKDLR